MLLTFTYKLEALLHTIYNKWISDELKCDNTDFVNLLKRLHRSVALFTQKLRQKGKCTLKPFICGLKNLMPNTNVLYEDLKKGQLNFETYRLFWNRI